MTDVARISKDMDLFCLIEGCGYARGFGTMEELEFVMVKHFQNAHGIKVTQRTGDEDGEVVRIPG